MKEKKKLNRRLWRYYKRTRLRARARQVAKEVLRESHLSKRKALTKQAKQKTNKKCKHWFQANILDHKREFKQFRKNFICQCSDLGNKSHLGKIAKGHKIKPNQRIKVATLNVRGLNHITKRETLVKIMKQNQYEVLLLTETNVNLGCVEKWDGYTAFFSTSIDPKVRDREVARRENNSLGKEKQDWTSHRLAADFENAGVAIVLKKQPPYVNKRFQTSGWSNCFSHFCFAWV